MSVPELVEGKKTNYCSPESSRAEGPRTFGGTNAFLYPSTSSGTDILLHELIEIMTYNFANPLTLI